MRWQRSQDHTPLDVPMSSCFRDSGHLPPSLNRSIGPSEVAMGGFKAGCFRLPLVGGGFLNYRLL